MAEIKNVPYKLPEGWKWVELKNISKIVMGQSPSSTTYNEEGNGLPFYQGKKKFGDIYLKTPSVWCTEPKKVAKRDNLLISVRAPVGDINMAEEVCSIGRGLSIIEPGENILLFYMLYFFRFYKPFWKGKGATFKAIKKIDLENVLIPIPFKNSKPDIEKQKEIVEKIDEIFERIKKTEKLKQRILEKTNFIFNSILNKIFGDIKKEEGWKWVKFGDVGKYINGRAFKPSEWEEKGFPIVRIKNLNNPNAKFNFYSKLVKSRYYINDGDLLISWSASLDVYIWNRGIALLNQHIFKVELNENIVQKIYMYFVVKHILRQIVSKTHGATMKHVTKNKFVSITIPIPFKNGKPDLEKQKEIVEYLDKLSEKVKQLEELQELELEKLKSFKESILNKAFRGELI